MNDFAVFKLKCMIIKIFILDNYNDPKHLYL